MERVNGQIDASFEFEQHYIKGISSTKNSCENCKRVYKIPVMNFTFELKKDPSPADEEVLLNGVNEEDRKIRNVSPIEYYTLFLRNSEKVICGGISTVLYYGCIFLDLLWVSAELRNKGWGSKLVEEVLRIGKEKGCSFANLHTMEWQAVSFYKKLGFHIEYISHGYQNNSKLYVLRKDFSVIPSNGRLTEEGEIPALMAAITPATSQ